MLQFCLLYSAAISVTRILNQTVRFHLLTPYNLKASRIYYHIKPIICKTAGAFQAYNLVFGYTINKIRTLTNSIIGAKARAPREL